jgi:MFS family permease
MNYFWGNFFEYCKERRNAAVFFGTLALLIIGLVLGGILYQISDGWNFLQYWPMMLPGIGLVLLALIWRGLRQFRRRRLDRYKSSPLSRDERTKARSKLIRAKHPK